MRSPLIALLLGSLLIAGCKRNEAKGQTGSGTGSTVHTEGNDTEREQARFDAERHPEKVIEALGIKPGSKVADVGAGSGLLTVHLARAVKPNGKVVATDIDEGVLELMQSRLQAAGLADYVDRKVVEADTPGLEKNEYDAILLAEVDHYFSDPVTWLRTAAQSLKPGGRLVISNRIHHRAKSIAAATKAGLKTVSESTPVPSHFIAVFMVPEGTK
ncbi:MAG: methyltransferase domain-containing protein [Deltaproteobacteria bacterium]|nr:methyltransferase domain-containing protein [Deltaproteobacteria bacterium]